MFFFLMIVIDIESTGNDPSIHALVSIGAVDLKNSSRKFYGECKIWQGACVWEGDGKYYKNALEVNGFTLEQITDSKKLSLKQLLKRFFKWVEKCENITLIAQNPFFDTAFLKDSAKRVGLKYPFGDRTIDLHAVACAVLLQKRYNPPLKDHKSDLNTTKILNFVGLSKEPEPHNALTGAIMEAEAFMRLIYGRGIFKQFKEYPLPDYLHY